MVKETQSYAQIIGVNIQSALLFDDPITGSEILSKLGKDQNIEIACVLKPGYKYFTTYRQDTANAQWVIIKHKYANGNFQFSKKYLEVTEDIYFDNEKIAIIYLKSNLGDLNEQMNDLIKTLIWVSLFSYLIAIISIRIISNYITHPLLNLARVTNKITSLKDYGLRVPKITSHTEIAILYNGFNEMLDVIEEQNYEINLALSEISDQKNAIEEQHNKIEKQSKILQTWKQDITSSIKYAKNIQQNMLLTLGQIHELYNDIFVFFKPRDIVSGDFYWIDKKGDELILCAADCTGHGVPGAMISVIGFNFLNHIINERRTYQPHNILNALDKNIIQLFKKDINGHASDDGMDLGICNINLKSLELSFAGANNSAYVIRNGELIELMPDKHSLGSGAKIIVRKNGFSLTKIQLQTNDVVYLYSDGFMDQFGGEKGKKYMKKNFKLLLTQMASFPIDSQHDLIDRELKNWMGSKEPQVDDIIIIGIKV